MLPQVQHIIDPRAWIVGDGKRELTPNRQRLAEPKWRPKYLPTPERQSGSRPGQESFSCVSQSLCNIVEMQLQFDYENNLLSSAFRHFLERNGYIDLNGNVNLDDQMLAKESGTTRAGNSLDNVVETARRIGFAPWRPYDWDKFTWDSYYAVTPAKQLALGLQFLSFIDLNHWWMFLGSYGSKPEDTIATLAFQLLEGPLWLADMAHAKVITEAHQGSLSLGIFDTYNPFDYDQDLRRLSAFWVKKVFVVEKNTRKLPPYLPYFEKIEGEPTIAAFDLDTFEMVPFDSGKAFKMTAGEYGKAVKRTKEQGWSYPLSTNRRIIIT